MPAVRWPVHGCPTTIPRYLGRVRPGSQTSTGACFMNWTQSVAEDPGRVVASGKTVLSHDRKARATLHLVTNH